MFLSSFNVCCPGKFVCTKAKLLITFAFLVSLQIMEDTAKEYGFGALKRNAAEEDEEYNEMYYINIHLF